MNPIDRMLASLREEYSARDARESRERSAAIDRERALAAERDRAALSQRAKRYLATLDPTTREGRWFDDFATHYASREDAAVEVLRAQDELDRSL